MSNGIFREKTVKRISSPEQLTDYLKVTNPGIWLILSVVILILVGLFAWANVGILTTTEEASAIVSNGMADIVVLGKEDDSFDIKGGTKVTIADSEYIISSIDIDEFGRTIAHAEVPLADGMYDAQIIVEEMHPVEFLVESR